MRESRISLFFFSLNLNEYEQFKKEMKNKNKTENKRNKTDPKILLNIT